MGSFILLCKLLDFRCSLLWLWANGSDISPYIWSQNSCLSHSRWDVGYLHSFGNVLPSCGHSRSWEARLTSSPCVYRLCKFGRWSFGWGRGESSHLWLVNNSRWRVIGSTALQTSVPVINPGLTLTFSVIERIWRLTTIFTDWDIDEKLWVPQLGGGGLSEAARQCRNKRKTSFVLVNQSVAEVKYLHPLIPQIFECETHVCGEQFILSH